MMTTLPGSTSGSGHSAPQSREELTLSSFAALLSSAQLTGTNQPLLASHEPALARLVSPHPHTRGSDEPRCTFPSLKIKNNVSASQASHLLQNSTLQDSASLNLAIPVAMTRGDVERAPVVLLNNITESFESLVASRLRSSVLALYQTFKTLSHGSMAPEARALLDILKPRKRPIKVTTTVTSFQVLPALEGGQSVGADGSVNLPLIFEAIIDVDALGTQLTVSLKAPGTVAGALNPTDSLIDHVEVAFDSIQLLQSMMKHARSVVKKTIAVACGMAPKLSYSYAQVGSVSSPAQPPEEPSSAYELKLSHANLEQFNANGKRPRDQVGTDTDENDGSSTLRELQSSYHPALHHKTVQGSGNEEHDEHEPLPRRLSNLSEYQPEDEVPNSRNAEFNFFNSKAPWMQPQPSSSFSSENSIIAALARSKGSRGSMVNSYFDLNKASNSIGNPRSIDEKESGSTRNAEFSSLAPAISIRDLYSKFDLDRATQQQQQDRLSKKKRVSFSNLKECFT